MFERRLASRGFRRLAGVDEAGRGPLAGPVVAAACLFKEKRLFPGINDSKLLTPVRRKALYKQITSELEYGIGVVSPEVIDEINILQATFRAMREAVLALSEPPDYLLIDGNFTIQVGEIPAECVIKGDQRSHAIAAASIIAKEVRDALMLDYHEQYPHYGFDQHKGYGTEKHRQALLEHGPCPIHRLSFAPVKEVYGGHIHT